MKTYLDEAKRKQLLDDALIFNWTEQLINVLLELRKFKIIHRDIKPE